jgi:rSAM/selenodomain-associated transferase 2
MRVSAVIPSWQEAGWIPDSVAAARAVADEVVVVDGGSTDGSSVLALRAGAFVIDAPRGRGQQLAVGARAATGDVLLFLHADTMLPPEARGAIERALGDPSIVGGNFYLRFEPQTRLGRLFTRIYDLRRRMFGIYYGDSPTFVRRDVYERLGGFPEQPLFEDYAFARRLAQAGRTCYVRDVVAITSGRRYEARPIETLTAWVVLQTLYSFGVDPARLVRAYAPIRARPEHASKARGQGAPRRDVAV